MSFGDISFFGLKFEKNPSKSTGFFFWRGLGSIFKKKGWSFSVDGVVVGLVFETKDASSFHTLVEFIGWRSFGTTRVVEVWAMKKRPRCCLGDLLGMKSYPVVWGL